MVETVVASAPGTPFNRSGILPSTPEPETSAASVPAFDVRAVCDTFVYLDALHIVTC